MVQATQAGAWHFNKEKAEDADRLCAIQRAVAVPDKKTRDKALKKALK